MSRSPSNFRRMSIDRSRSNGLSRVKYLYPEYPDQYDMLPVYYDIETYDEPDIYTFHNNEHPLLVYIHTNGVVYYMKNGKKIIKSMRGRRVGIFVLDMYGNLYMSPRVLHHSDILSGEPVACAGEYQLDKYGRVVAINNLSGHYQPVSTCLDSVVSVIRENGYNDHIKIKRKV
jgi:hypothetical protein